MANNTTTTGEVPSSTNVVDIFNSWTEKLKGLDKEIISKTTSATSLIISSFKDISTNYALLSENINKANGLNINAEQINNMLSGVDALITGTSSITTKLAGKEIDTKALDDVSNAINGLFNIFNITGMKQFIKNYNLMHTDMEITNPDGTTEKKRMFFLDGLVSGVLQPLFRRLKGIGKDVKSAKIGELTSNLDGIDKFIKVIGNFATTAILLSPVFKVFTKLYSVGNGGNKSKDNGIYLITDIMKSVINRLLDVFCFIDGNKLTARFSSEDIKTVSQAVIFLKNINDQFIELINVLGSPKTMLKLLIISKGQKTIENSLKVFKSIFEFYREQGKDINSAVSSAESMKDIVKIFLGSFLQLVLSMPLIALTVLGSPIIFAGLLILKGVVMFMKWIGEIKFTSMLKSVSALILMLGTLALAAVSLLFVTELAEKIIENADTYLIFIGILSATILAVGLIGWLVNKFKKEIFVGIASVLLIFGSILISAYLMKETLDLLNQIDFKELAIKLLELGVTVLVAGAAFVGIGFLLTEGTAGMGAGLIAVGILACVIIFGALWGMSALLKGVFENLNSIKIDDDFSKKVSLIMDGLLSIAWGLAKAMPGLALAAPLLMLGMPTILMTSTIFNSVADVFKKANEISIEDAVKGGININLIMNLYNKMLKDLTKSIDDNMVSWGPIDSKMEDFFEAIEGTVSPVSKVVDLFQKVANMTMKEFDENGYLTGKEKAFDFAAIYQKAEDNVNNLFSFYASFVKDIYNNDLFEVLKANSFSSFFWDSPIEDMFEAIEGTVAPVSKVVDLFQKVANMTMKEFDEKGYPTGKEIRFDFKKLSDSAQENVKNILISYNELITSIATDETIKKLTSGNWGGLFDSDVEDMFEAIEGTVAPVSKIIDVIEKASKFDAAAIGKGIGITKAILKQYSGLYNKDNWKGLDTETPDKVSKSVASTVESVAKLDVAKTDKFIEMMTSMKELNESFGENLGEFIEALSEKLVPALNDVVEAFGETNKSAGSFFGNTDSKSAPSGTEAKQENKVDMSGVLAAIKNLTSEIASIKTQGLTVAPDRGFQDLLSR